MTEVWVDIHYGFYSVSSFGNVKRAKPGISTFIGRPVSPMRSATGYEQVSLGGTKKRRAYVHHLVMEGFCGERKKGIVVNHKDGNKQNNRLENLEYVTFAENSAHALKTIGRNRGPKMPTRPPKGKPKGDMHWTKTKPESVARGDRMPHSKMTPQMVISARSRVSNGEKQKDIAIEMGVSIAQISRIIRKTRWTYL